MSILIPQVVFRQFLAIYRERFLDQLSEGWLKVVQQRNKVHVILSSIPPRRATTGSSIAYFLLDELGRLLDLHDDDPDDLSSLQLAVSDDVAAQQRVDWLRRLPSEDAAEKESLV